MKAIEDLTFTDDYLFGAIMKKEEICKGVIERPSVLSSSPHLMIFRRLFAFFIP